MYPAGAIAATAPRWAVTSSTHQAPASGRLALYAVWLDAGDVVTNISFMSGTTAGAGLTNTWFALFSPTRALLGVTADDNAAAWAVSTVKTLALAAPVVVPASGIYYFGIVCVGTTRPTLVGATLTPILVNAGAPTTAGWSTAGLTNPGSAPAIAGDPAAGNIAGWAWAWAT